MEKELAANAALSKVSCGKDFEIVTSSSPLGLECKKKEKGKKIDGNN